jgi:hypothetical protein
MAGRTVVATGSWSVPASYPDGVQARDRLASLAERLEAVEVDSCVAPRMRSRSSLPVAIDAVVSPARPLVLLSRGARRRGGGTGLAEDRRRPCGQPTWCDGLAPWRAARLPRMIGVIGIPSNDRFNEGTR